MENIILSREEIRRISQFLDAHEARDAVETCCMQLIARKIETARAVPVRDLPRTAISMYSTVKVVHLARREAFNYTLVYPRRANEFGADTSLLSPAGAALLGACEGATVTYFDADTTVALAVKEVLFQPEWDQWNRFSQRGYASAGTAATTPGADTMKIITRHHGASGDGTDNF